MILSNARSSRVEAATVCIGTDGRFGQGILVHGGFILTATHCIRWSGTGGMVLGDHFLETITTKSGKRFHLSPCFADPVSDLAALCEPDNQELPEDAEAFEEWREAVKPIPLSRLRLRPQRLRLLKDGHIRVSPPASARVHILAHTGSWIIGRVSRHGSGPHTDSVHLESEKPILGGTSGGPVVDDLGQLVGVVSNGIVTGTVPWAYWVLPRWIWKRIQGGEQ